MATIAKALRDRKTFGQTIATARRRAVENAVSNKGVETDFKTQDQIDYFQESQFKLRNLKTSIATKTVTTFVKIPDDVPVNEAGKEVNLYQAILIRDDLKAQKQFFENLINLRCDADYRWRGEKEEIIERVRNFDFDALVVLIDKIQDSIDIVDSVIQYTDNTENI